ncbi:MAG: AsmA family protein, partial [Gammaproteobacteria bacterium]|nr:AsmA family protein [Gammaproteobacteria bacterium]
MKGTLKWLGIVVGAIVGLFVILAIAAPLLVDPNDYKETVVEAVKDRTGRDLRIPGNIELTVFPWIGVELGEAELSNAEGFTEPVFARTEKVNVRVKLLPLLSRRLEMDTVTIHGLTLNLERNARGRGNWEDLAAAGEAKSAPAKPSDGGAGTGGAPDAGAIGALAIGGLDVRDATLTWRDTTKNQRYELHNLSLQTGAIEEGEPVDLDMSVDVSVGEPRIDGHVSMAGKVLADPRAGTTRIEGLSIDGDFTGESLPGGKAEVSLAADVSHDAAKGTLALESLAVRALDLVLEGALQASGLDGAPRFTGQLASNEFNLRELIEALTGKAPDTADAKAMSRVSLKTGIGGGANALALEPLEVVLDQSTLRGKASVPDLSAQALRFDLALDAIDIDRYLPPSGAQGAGGAGQSAPAASTPGTAAGAAAGAPNEQLRKLDVDGRLTAGKIKVAKLNMSEVSAVVKAK